jgi:hypothetical protein
MEKPFAHLSLSTMEMNGRSKTVPHCFYVSEIRWDRLAYACLLLAYCGMLGTPAISGRFTTEKMPVKVNILWICIKLHGRLAIVFSTLLCFHSSLICTICNWTYVWRWDFGLFCIKNTRSDAEKIVVHSPIVEQKDSENSVSCIL